MILRNRLIVVMLAVIISGSLPLSSVQAQGVMGETVASRDLVIELGDGLTTDAQLTFPAGATGPFPGVLLVHGSGNTDMDEYISPPVAPEGKPVRLFLQIAEYLSERGFAVLRYNKRGVGLNGTLLDRNVYFNITFQELVSDAEKAVDVLRKQAEVDASAVTIIGHSEGTLIAPRIAIEDPSIRNIVLMSAAAHSVYDIVHWQAAERNIIYAEELFDTNNDGLLSIEEVVDAQSRGELPLGSLIRNINGSYAWYPGVDADEDGYFSIHEEWQPLLEQALALITNSDPNSPFYDKWLQSQLALEDTNLDLIGKVSASILILNGENDIQTPVQEAFILEQKLTEIGHPDHTLITYPDLGHSFYPAKGLNQPLGSIREYVLSDLASWLKDPNRELRYLKTQAQEYETTIADLQDQLADSNSELEDLQGQLAGESRRFDQEILSTQNQANDIQSILESDLEATSQKISDLEGQTKELQSETSTLKATVEALESRNRELQSAQDMATNLSYIAIGIAAVTVLAAILTRRRPV